MVIHALEFLLLFFAGPTLFAYTHHRIPAIPALWGLLIYCLYFLLTDPRFDRSRLWSIGSFGEAAPTMLGLFTAAVIIGIVVMLRYGPAGLFLNMARTNPGLWALLMVLYPLLSVYPQGVIYRAFIFQRYQDLFGHSWGMVGASAAAFTYVHIVYRNRLALILTAMGGVLFGLRYLQTGSVLVSSFEHALYGCAIFTIGVGDYFYYRARPRASDSAVPL